MKDKIKFDYKLLIILFINIFIFAVVNVIFNIKYEQVDDFIIYNLYSGLDGTYNIHGVYIHPIICFVISIFYRLMPVINWHSIFLIVMQFTCLTLIGYRIIKKHDNALSIVLYTVFASVMFTSLLLLIQYTSVAALLIFTSLFLLIDKIETEKKLNIKNAILIFSLFAIGAMIRLQAILIIAPFFAIYFIVKAIKYLSKKIDKQQIIKLIKYYLVYGLITVVIYLSSIIIYNSNEVYKNYMEYNQIRTLLHDRMSFNYNEDKEVFDEIGWSKNDFYMFFTFGFGDENIYSKENLQKILDYKIQKDGIQKINTDIEQVMKNFVQTATNTHIAIFCIATLVFVISLFNKRKENILIYFITIAINLMFIIMERDMHRVVIPEYIAGTALMLYNLSLKKKPINDSIKNCAIICCLIVVTSFGAGKVYEYDYKLSDYKNIQTIINYTNENKQNVYLYTVPSLQFRYLAYSAYQMPPKSAFSNLRVIGGWDIFTQNYYDFKSRYNLDGTLLDLLKDNVYLIDGDVVWSGIRYDNYKQNIIQGIKENYNKDVECTEVETFDNIKIYKLQEK